MERYPHTHLTSVIETLPARFRGVEVKEGSPIGGDPHVIEGYTFDRALNCLLYFRPSSEALAANHVMRLTMKPPLTRGVELFDFLKNQIRDGYNLIPGVRIEDRPEHLVVLPSSKYIYQDAVNFGFVQNLINTTEKVAIKPHPDSTEQIMQELEKTFPGKILSKDDMLQPYLRAAKRLWISSQSEAGISAIINNKPFEFIDNTDCKSVIPSFRSLYRGIGISPTKASFKDKLIRCLSYPESGLIVTGTGFEEDDIKRFFTQYVLHNHAT